MKAIYLALLSMMCITNYSNAQNYIEQPTINNNDSLIFYNKKFKTNYSNIENIYSNYYKISDEIKYNENGAPLVAQYGIIDNSNNVVIKPIYGILNKLGDKGLLYAISGRKNISFIYDLKTKDTIYKGINDVKKIENDKFFIISKNNFYGVIDNENKLLIPFNYNQIEYLNNTFYLLKGRELSNSNSKITLKNVQNFELEYEGFVKVENDKKKYSLYDMNFNSKFLLKDYISVLSKSIFCVIDNNKKKLHLPNKIIPIENNSDVNLNNKFIWVFIQNNVKIYNLNGVLKYNFKNVKTYESGIILESEYQRIQEIIEK